MCKCADLLMEYCENVKCEERMMSSIIFNL